ncbi:MAG TPA: response regulator transcription factor [Baekduia sp.]|nr:response regulator transcription factor [Baekduia sp.]
MAPARRVLLAIEHPAVREALHALLDGEPGVQVVREAVTLRETVVLTRGCTPDVLIVGANLADGSALQGVIQLKYASPRTRIIVVTMQTSPDFAARALEMGAHRVIPLDRAHDQLVPAILSTAYA